MLHMEQLEILDLAMLGILRLMDNSTDAAEHIELSAKLKELARLFVIEQEENFRKGIDK